METNELDELWCFDLAIFGIDLLTSMLTFMIILQVVVSCLIHLVLIKVAL